MKPSVQIKPTEDGSYTLYQPEIDECYHSIHGAKNESNHIFLEAALRQHSGESISIFEAGFGTGLNAWLTLQEAERTQRHISYTTIEIAPLTPELFLQLNYAETADKTLFNKLHEAPWNTWIEITPHFKLFKILGDLTEIKLTPQSFDVVFFDAFSPEKQPQLWSEQVFKTVADAMKLGGILTTYCAKGIVRRTMQSVGLTVERIPGPIGKREILRAKKLVTN